MWGRNPFVNQVASFVRGRQGLFCRPRRPSCRNPFVNQVASFKEGKEGKVLRPPLQSQSLRESGRFVPGKEGKVLRPPLQLSQSLRESGRFVQRYGYLVASRRQDRQSQSLRESGRFVRWSGRKFPPARSRNPFVNQVASFYLWINIYSSSYFCCRNPFVNQVASFVHKLFFEN